MFKAEYDLVSPSGNQNDPVDWATLTCKALPSNPEDAGPLVKTGFLVEPTSKSSSELENGSKVDAMTGSRVSSGFDFVRKESSSYESRSTSGESSLWKMSKHPRLDNPRLDHPRSDNSRLDHPRSDNSRLDHPRPDNSRLDYMRSDNSRLDHPRLDNSRLDNSTLNGSDSFYSFSGKSAKRFNGNVLFNFSLTTIVFYFDD